MLFDLKNKVAVVTGGGSGIGKAIAEVFAEQGAQVCILELTSKAAKESARALTDQRLLAKGYTCDVTHLSEVVSSVQAIVKKFGRIDILVNCAGIAHIGKLETTSAEDFEKVFQINVRGVYNSMVAVIPTMTKQKYGVILNVASVAGSTGIKERFAYSMSKGAVLSMTLSTAKDYIKEGIRCNSISPARVHTPFVDGFLKNNYPGKEDEMFEKLSQTQPIGRMAKPVEVAHFALYLCSDEASFLTGCDYLIDGGFTKLNN
jgi:NAD(P)-dependent dehydrogenase (short-subunit alcohol dehydrogenase family)